MKIQVIGNCQARPLAAILSKLLNAESLPPILLHLARPEEEETYRSQLKQADLILAQKTADGFRIPCLRSAEINREYKNTIIWPNIFWGAQQPFLRYFSFPNGERVMGPLEAMHDLRIFNAWLEARAMAQTSADAAFSDHVRNEIRLQSLRSLKEREDACDLSISDFLEERVDTDILFFTFNHPSSLVLFELAKRVVARATDGFRLSAELEPIPEPLGRYIVPSDWPNPQTEFQGDAFELKENRRVQRKPGPPVKYDAASLKSAFFGVYDHIFGSNIAETRLRLTPDFPSDYLISSIFEPAPSPHKRNSSSAL